MKTGFVRNLLSVAAMGAICMAAGLSRPACADPYTMDSGWTAFSFGGVGSGASGNPYTFVAPGTGGLLTVTDAYLSGDRFSIYDFGALLGLTSAPGSVGDQILGDADGAAADPRWSSGSFMLGSGAHSIEIFATDSPYGSGGAFLRVDTASAASTPEPATMALLGSGIVGLVTKLRRRKTEDEAAAA